MRIRLGIAAVAAVVGLVLSWLRNRRLGTGFVNRFVNPALVRGRLAGFGGSEIGTLEHIGRRSGLPRLTPVHPVRTSNGFRIVVPLGVESQWVRNVLAAGHCRLQLHGRLYQLDEPKVLEPRAIASLPALVRRMEQALGFRYLVVRTSSRSDGEVAPLAA